MAESGSLMIDPNFLPLILRALHLCPQPPANDHLLLKNFSAYLTLTAVDVQPASLSKEFMVPCFKTEKLSVTFSPSPNSWAFVNGVEVVSMPKNMYVKHQDDSVSS
ncbi:probable receptor-like protein kinase At5g39030 [Gossypium hirsutum]|uniref:Probable receptor-like protein kinase At5g39030 n=1 Tax=Gossypium hirsutum TaxID=3635 RepID=A0ABM3C2I6_GOSHI|nr:probable receptor-like protein kinase At5g39030 [Gossypium hirsutum]